MGSGESWLYDWFYDNQIINETPTIWENFRLIPGTAGIVTGGNPTILGKNLLKELDAFIKKVAWLSSTSYYSKRTFESSNFKKNGNRLR